MSVSLINSLKIIIIKTHLQLAILEEKFPNVMIFLNKRFKKVELRFESIGARAYTEKGNFLFSFS
jgi:hypothetical protein